MFTIDTLVGHERMSTQDLLLAIGQAVAQGETEFEEVGPGTVLSGLIRRITNGQ